MNPERWTRVKDLFEAALDRPNDARDAFLDEACADDSLLRAEVASLLEFEGRTLSPPRDMAARLAEAVSRDTLSSGHRVGPYVIDQEIGRGGMGAVYRARRIDAYEKVVAIKVVKRGMDTDDIVRRFTEERQALANLDHPNIARLLDGGTIDDRPYFVMEEIKGQPIDEYCDARQLTIDQRLALFQQVCAGVHHAHQNLIVHRDIKPDNILVTAEGVPKLLDFGIAKMLQPDAAGVTVQQTRIMTPEYASPEQVRGDRVATSTDVYSLGVLLYELLCGHRPYRVSRSHPSEVERAVLASEPVPPSAAALRASAGEPNDPPPPSAEANAAARRTSPSALRRRLRGDLDNIVAMAMRKEASRRYKSVEQLSEDLRRHLDRLPVIARPDTFGYRAVKFAGRHRAAVAAALLVACGLIGGATIAIWQARIAQLEARKSDRINAFLQDMLGSSNPYEQGKTVTVVEVLNRAAGRIDQELANEADVRAALHETVGSSFLSMGSYDASESHLRSALDSNLATYGPNHEIVARNMSKLGAVLFLKSNYKEAERLLGDALAIQKRVVGEVHPDTARTVDWLGRVYNDTGRPAEAERAYREALADYRILRKQSDAESLSKAIATELNNLAVSTYSRGDLTQATALYSEALAIYRTLPPSPDLATVLQNLGVMFRMQRRHAEARDALMEAVRTRVTLLGERHPLVAIARAHLADLYLRDGNYAAARKEAQDAFEIQKEKLPAGHVDMARSLSVLGLIETRTGELAEGERNLREAVRIRHNVLPPDHWLVAVVESALGECLMLEGRFVEAEGLLTRSSSILAKQFDDGDERAREAASRVTQLKARMAGSPDPPHNAGPLPPS